MGNIGNYEVDCMALICSSTIAHLYHLLYDCSNTQQLIIDCSDKRRSLLLSFAYSCLARLQL